MQQCRLVRPDQGSAGGPLCPMSFLRRYSCNSCIQNQRRVQSLQCLGQGRENWTVANGFDKLIELHIHFQPSHSPVVNVCNSWRQLQRLHIMNYVGDPNLYKSIYK